MYLESPRQGGGEVRLNPDVLTGGNPPQAPQEPALPISLQNLPSPPGTSVATSAQLGLPGFFSLSRVHAQTKPLSPLRNSPTAPAPEDLPSLTTSAQTLVTH